MYQLTRHYSNSNNFKLFFDNYMLASILCLYAEETNKQTKRNKENCYFHIIQRGERLEERVRRIRRGRFFCSNTLYKYINYNLLYYCIPAVGDTTYNYCSPFTYCLLYYNNRFVCEKKRYVLHDTHISKTHPEEKRLRPLRESNPRPFAYQANALPSMLKGLTIYTIIHPSPF